MLGLKENKNFVQDWKSSSVSSSQNCRNDYDQYPHMGRFFHRRHERPNQVEPHRAENGSQLRSSLTASLREQVNRLLGQDGCNEPNISNKEAMDIAARLSLSHHSSGVSRGEMFRILLPIHYTMIQRRILGLCFKRPHCKKILLAFGDTETMSFEELQKRCGSDLLPEDCQMLEDMSVLMGTRNAKTEMRLSPLGRTMASFLQNHQACSDNELIKACIRVFEHKGPGSRRKRRKKARDLRKERRHKKD